MFPFCFDIRNRKKLICVGISAKIKSNSKWFQIYLLNLAFPTTMRCLQMQWAVIQSVWSPPWCSELPTSIVLRELKVWKNADHWLNSVSTHTQTFEIKYAELFAIPGGKLKTWRKKWFVLKNGVLTYYKSQSDINRKPQGQILLDEACKITRAEGSNTFEIDTGKKTYYLTADTITAMEDWVRIVF